MSAGGRNRQAPTKSSRDDLGGAGWTCRSPGSFKAFVPNKPPLSWLDPRTLWESRNDTVAEKLGDPERGTPHRPPC